MANLELEKDYASEEASILNYGPIHLVVIQPTTFCNLDCDYCYLPDRQSKHIISLDLLEPIFYKVFSSPFLKGGFTIVWHAGEPLTVNPSFYESAIEIINNASQKYNSKNYPFEHSIQTNGTLINQAWCDLIKKHQIRIGISLDGPAFLHDSHRKTRTGLGTHSSTMRGISYLKKNDINFSVIAVITEESLEYPDEIFQFFVENEINNIGFNVEEIEAANPNSSLSDKTDSKYYAFMSRFYSLVNESKGVLKVREFERITRSILKGNENVVGQFHPFSILSFDYKGNFMTFSPELLSISSSEYGEFILGNVLTDPLESVCYTEKFIRMNNDIQMGVERCRETCQYFSLCGGGAPANKYFENGSFNSTETIYCRYTEKILADIVLTDLEKYFGLV